MRMRPKTLKILPEIYLILLDEGWSSWQKLLIKLLLFGGEMKKFPLLFADFSYFLKFSCNIGSLFGLHATFCVFL